MAERNMGMGGGYVSISTICFMSVSTYNLAGAEKLVKYDRMVSAPIDLSYMGVFTIWTNDLGTLSPGFPEAVLTFFR